MSSTSTGRAPAIAPSPESLSLRETAPTFRPSALQGIGLIVRRELGTYLRSRSGYIIAALVLLIDGLLYNVFAVGSTSRYSTDVLSDFFRLSSGVTMIATAFISMRLIAEERQNGSLPLLTTSSLSDGEIVIAKFLSGFLFLAALLAITFYMPLLIFVHGKVSMGHIFAGYLGLLALGAACTAIGTFGSAIASSQIVAAVIYGALIVLLLQASLLARIVEGPAGDVIAYADLYVKHFVSFQGGTVSMKGIVFYLSITGLFLMLARNSLEGRRWRP